ncbi:beta-defensin 108B [Tupaia chinensis]|uniref:beta-defensin 108B n=1 Tax=Tupaia chinensis TaxID=246437 RepID=UPI000FFBB98F|nr:beta-defensin 108B [Tupaia chinensis]
MKPSFLLSSAMRIAVFLFTSLFLMSQVLPARGKFKEVCERPNGSCQEFCIETEILVGKCIDRRPCCLPMGNQPRIESTTPNE